MVTNFTDSTLCHENLKEKIFCVVDNRILRHTIKTLLSYGLFSHKISKCHLNFRFRCTENETIKKKLVLHGDLSIKLLTLLWHVRYFFFDNFTFPWYRFIIQFIHRIHNIESLQFSWDSVFNPQYIPIKQNIIWHKNQNILILIQSYSLPQITHIQQVPWTWYNYIILLRFALK